VSQLRIAGGTVYDPANGINGEVRDVCIDTAHIVADLPASALTVDAGGMIVMPRRRRYPQPRGQRQREPRAAPPAGGARARSRACATVPTTFTTGYRHRHTRRPGAAARAPRQGTPRLRRGRRRHGLFAGRRRVAHVCDAPIRGEGGRAYDRAVERRVEQFFDRYSSVSFANYPVGALGDAPIAG